MTTPLHQNKPSSFQKVVCYLKKYTKQQIFVVLLFANVSLSFSQDTLFNQREEYLFSNISLNKVNGFGAFTTQFTSMNNDFAVCNGVCGGVLFNQTFFLGAYGMGLSSQIESDLSKDSISEYIGFSHGGPMIGFNFSPHKLVHLTTNAKVGWGSFNSHAKDDFEKTVAEDVVFVFNPEFGAEMNITKWFKINATAGYRFVSGIDLISYYNEKDLSAPTASISLLFGGFHN